MNGCRKNKKEKQAEDAKNLQNLIKENEILGPKVISLEAEAQNLLNSAEALKQIHQLTQEQEELLAKVKDDLKHDDDVKDPERRSRDDNDLKGWGEF